MAIQFIVAAILKTIQEDTITIELMLMNHSMYGK